MLVGSRSNCIWVNLLTHCSSSFGLFGSLTLIQLLWRSNSGTEFQCLTLVARIRADIAWTEEPLTRPCKESADCKREELEPDSCKRQYPRDMMQWRVSKMRYIGEQLAVSKDLIQIPYPQGKLPRHVRSASHEA